MGYAEKRGVSAEDYLATEVISSERNEYFNGLVYAMTGGTSAHNLLALNLFSALKPHLKGSPCRAYVNDMRLYVEAANCYFYPDLLLHCEAVAPDTSMLGSAKVVVEVLSPSTSSYDQGRKFDMYRQLPSLEEYILIDSSERNVRVLRRADHGDWIFHAYKNDEVIHFSSIDFSLSMQELYEDTGV